MIIRGIPVAPSAGMRPRHVVVAGAGLAGLAAAHELSQHGLAITIVEARDRVGGRVWTVGHPFPDGHHGELGGEFIDADQKQMHRLAALFGLPLVPVLRGGFVQRFRSADGGFTVGRAHTWQALGRAFAPLVARYRAAGGRLDSEAVREISTYSVRDWLRHVEADGEVHAVANAMRGFFLGDPEELSALPLVEQLTKQDSPGQTSMSRIVGGNGRLIDALVSAITGRLLLRHTIRSIAHAVDRVIVRVHDDRGLLQEIEADAAIVTLPACVLRGIEITPPLPDDQHHAIASLRYGRATKVVLANTGSLLSRRHARAFATDTALGAFWDSTEGQIGQARSTLTFLAGGSASAMLRQRARDGASRLLDDLCWLHLDRGRDRSTPAPLTEMAVATWEEDPLAQGGYAVFDPGFDPAWRPLLSRRAGRLVFAGEHTSEKYQGYMEGAVESGIRAAHELGA